MATLSPTAIGSGEALGTPGRVQSIGVFARDTFTGSDGATLQSRRGEDADWVKIGAAVDAQIAGNAAVASAAGTSLYRIAAIPVSSSIAALDGKVTALSSSGNGAGLCTLFDGNATFYMYRWNPSSSGNLQFYKCVSGTFTLLWSISWPLSNGASVLLRIESTKGAHRLYADGVLKVVNGDTSITSGSYVGVRIATLGGPTTNASLDDFRASDWQGVGGNGIATGQAIGAAKVSMGVSGAGAVAGAAAVGSPSLSLGLTAGGLPSGEAFGSARLDLGVSAAGAIASAEAVGSPSAGFRLPAAGGVSSGEAFGSPALSLSVSPGGVSSGEVIGAAVVSPGPVLVHPSGIAGASALGSAVVSAGAVLVSAAGGVSSGEAVGGPAVLPGAVTVSSAGAIAGAAVVPGPVLHGSLVVSPGSISSGEALSQPLVAPGAVSVSPSGIATGGAYGLPEVRLLSVLSPSGIASGEAAGSPAVLPGAVLVSDAGSITSAAAVGGPAVLRGALIVSPAAISSAEAVGGPAAVPGAVHVSAAGGIVSAAAAGSPLVSPGAVTLAPSGIASAEAVGGPLVAPTLPVADAGGVPSAEAVGDALVSPGAAHVSSAGGVPSAAAVGGPAVLRGAVTVAPTGIASAGALGHPALSSVVRLSPGGIGSAQAVGSARLVPGAVTVRPGAIASASAFGTARFGALRASDAIDAADRYWSPPTDLVGIGRPQGDGPDLGAWEYVLPVDATVSPSGIASAGGVGHPTFSEPVPRTVVSVGAITSREAFGAALVYSRSVLRPSGVPTGAAFGQALLGVRVLPAGIVSAGALGVPSLSWPRTVEPGGIGSAEAFPVPRVAFPDPSSITVGPGIASGAVVPAPRIGALIVPAGILSGEAVATPIIVPASPATLLPAAVPSAEAVPGPRVRQGTADRRPGHVDPIGAGRIGRSRSGHVNEGAAGTLLRRRAGHVHERGS